MNTKTRGLLNALISTIFAVGGLLLFSNAAEARIVVEGNRKFTDEVHHCLTTYRNTPGLVGDAIKELENSRNVHKVSESPDWENTADDATKASNGTGSGTHTRVSSDRLEKLKQRIQALKHKDFCTAFLHELWHAVDADRGNWSNVKKNNVWEDEIEATMFQNFIHALRGVPPRTTYGNADISAFLPLTDAETGKTTTSVEMLRLRNGYFPRSQFRIASPDACGAEHYHGGKVFGIKEKTGSEIVTATDPNPNSCGFGKVSEVPVETIGITLEQLTELSKNGVQL